MTKVYSTVVANQKDATIASYIKLASTVEKLTKKEKKLLKKYFFIDIDLAFQSRARWDKSTKEKFINSCLIDMNISKYVLVDVERCRDASHKG